MPKENKMMTNLEGGTEEKTPLGNIKKRRAEMEERFTKRTLTGLEELSAYKDKLFPPGESRPKTHKKNAKKETIPAINQEKGVGAEKTPIVNEKIDREASIEEVAELLKNKKISHKPVETEVADIEIETDEDLND